ncbi:hypothetical protein MLD38_010620 [Melastoma candidum]|uniref:Uncharacterized protein n=1 Tax=Melastoma candidum TaxID=119954 RepID=A0ACB9R1I3_9MYRT|nr:hypothetical protein MLD38_010620 [Melastoma candidum]
MYAEFPVLSPLVPSRETYVLRYCQQNVEKGSWAVVNFPMNGFLDNLPAPPLPRYRRRPSGCVIQDMPNGYSRVTWVEHAEIEEKPVYPLFSQLVESGAAFGAQRWLAVLQRQCERVASLMARNISDLGGSYSISGSKEEPDEIGSEDDENVQHQFWCLRRAAEWGRARGCLHHLAAISSSRSLRPPEGRTPLSRDQCYFEGELLARGRPHRKWFPSRKQHLSPLLQRRE